MQITTSIIIQALALFVSLLVTLLRGWVRLGLEQRALTAPDYLVWGGWLCTLGWFICSIISLNIGKDHPVDPDTGETDSVPYLKTVFIGSYLFDLGLYVTKGSIIIFYWWLIPKTFRRLRLGLYLTTAFVVAAFISTILMDTLNTVPISNNWSLEKQLESIWNSVTGFIVNWVLNISTDISRLVGIFSLGLITILISTSRFIAYSATDYDLDDSTGNAWCTIEMSTAVIVVSLPGLKSLFVKSKSPRNTSDNSNNRYIHKSSRQPSGHKSFASRARVEEEQYDDELELIPYGQNSTLATSQTPSEKREPDIDGAVTVTTNVTVTRESSASP
ncbi:hypothetical protein FGRMN_11235 [Fusarium graminum]|nr:hypothetical protein FGRMN_11235 [Fusarium graminum]